MASEDMVLPLRWSLPEPPIPRWTCVAIGVLVAAGIVEGVINRAWISMVVPISIGISSWMQADKEPRSDFELTYAAVHGTSSLLGPTQLEWGKIRHHVVEADAILLYAHRLRSPLVLRLPDDPDLRDRIRAAVERKLAIWNRSGGESEPSSFISASE